MKFTLYCFMACLFYDISNYHVDMVRRWKVRADKYYEKADAEYKKKGGVSDETN